MNQINLRIVLTDGTILEVVTSAGDLVNWEKHFDLGIDKLEKITHLLYLAWLAVTRLKKTGHDFDAWIETISNIEVDDQKKA
jgi:hypothetical protein